MRFANPHLIRQVAILRLSPDLLTSIAQQRGLEIDISRNNTASTEVKLLEILERYEEELDKAHEFLENPALVSALAIDDLTDLTIEALKISGAIEQAEGDNYYSLLFKGIDSYRNLLSSDIEIFCQNLEKICELAD